MDEATARACSALIHYAAVGLRMSEHTRAKALVFFHRYYAQRAVDDRLAAGDAAELLRSRAQLIPQGGQVRQLVLERQEPQYAFVVASACLFLASKCAVVEQPVKLGSVVTTVYALRHADDECLRIGAFYWRRKDELIVAEHDLLKTLRFDVSVTLAFDHLLAFLRLLSADKQLASAALTVLCDCYRLPMCLLHEPHVLACAAIAAAAAALQVELPTSFQVPWYEAFGAPQDKVASIRAEMVRECSRPPVTRAELADELAQPPLGSHDAVPANELLYS
eukprot:CAMPEP_0114626544 /NCGR_PEP_ID=MMETSP0168-20121206/11836_1 /TAXON_ID=95228 ORGANISM="Vannella sp., Strain DIVA3 517/6/12" /NCGR_SAMPLE_ID=MMETSP0168 /ASSEMBLY_ACC=CAM_ASM_000044 /LENGTH=277 /DNA_ID=CAMNT_0001837851 /DNA_START=68 /DNA_END=898 /DNA_ORIENTATION=+